METLLMKGKPVADAYRETIIARVARALEKGRKVTLAIIVVGDDPASHVYKDRLMKLAESMGICEAGGFAARHCPHEPQPLYYRRFADDADAGAVEQRRCRYGCYRQQGCGLP